jgi:transposase
VTRLAEDEAYRPRVPLLTSMPGLGWLTALELLLELQEVARFRRADQLAAYVGLTPAQYSSGEHVRLGRITRQGKPTLRLLLVQLAWRLIGKDEAMRARYDELRGRAGGKRAIVAIARRLLLRIRHLLRAGEPYAVGLVRG